MKIFYSSLFFLLWTGCYCKSPNKYAFIENAGVYSIDWKMDTFGCHSYRYKKTDSVLKYQQQMLQLSKRDFISFFGEPNVYRTLSNNRQILFYINQPNLYCQGRVSKIELAMSDATAIYVIFDSKGQMLELGSKLP